MSRDLFSRRRSDDAGMRRERIALPLSNSSLACASSRTSGVGSLLRQLFRISENGSQPRKKSTARFIAKLPKSSAMLLAEARGKALQIADSSCSHRVTSPSSCAMRVRQTRVNNEAGEPISTRRSMDFESHGLRDMARKPLKNVSRSQTTVLLTRPRGNPHIHSDS